MSIYDLLSDYTFQIVAFGAVLLGIQSGVLGSFCVLRRQSLLGDGVSHSALAGVTMAFLLLGSKSIEALLAGAFISGIIAVLAINAIVRNSKIKFDSALALVMSVMFGFGMAVLTYLQKTPNANQAGLKSFIFGQASTLLKEDVQLMFVTGIIVLFSVLLFWKEFKLLSFDKEYTQTSGFAPKKLDTLLSLLTVVAIVTGLQTVGVILMSALLIAPAIAARQWTNKLGFMVILAAIFGGAAGLAGTVVSSLFDKMPTGPSIVVIISALAILSMIFAPGRGLLAKQLENRRAKKLYRQEAGHNVTSN